MNRSLFLPRGTSLLLRHQDTSGSPCQSTLSPWHLADCDQSTYLVHDDPVRIPPVSSNARAPLYIRYTPKDWWNFHHHQVASAQRILCSSRRLNRDNDCLVRVIEARTQTNQDASSKELANVKRDFHFWKNKLEEFRCHIIDTIDKLDSQRRQLESQLSKIAAQLKLAAENLYEREKRHQGDLVHDEVQCELIRLIDILTSGERELKNNLEQIDEQIRGSRELLREINLEANQKFNALIHQSAALHSNNTLPCYSNAEQLPQLSPTEYCYTDGITYIRWCKRMEGLLEKADCTLQVSKECLQSSSDLLGLEQTIVHQRNRVDDALERHIRELQCIRDQLQDQLDEVHGNILSTEKSIEFLRKTIQDQSVYADVIHCRVSFLSLRSPAENITDVEYPKLLEEFQDLQCSMARLRTGLSQEEDILQHLVRLKTTLQEDLATKNNSLFINQEKVVGQRRTRSFSFSNSVRNAVDHRSNVTSARC